MQRWPPFCILYYGHVQYMSLKAISESLKLKVKISSIATVTRYYNLLYVKLNKTD